MNDEFRNTWRAFSANQKRELAKRIDSDYTYLSQIANGHRTPGKHLRRALEAEIKQMCAPE